MKRLDGLLTGADSVGVESNWGQFTSNSSIASALTGERALPGLVDVTAAALIASSERSLPLGARDASRW
jgi:hypothetical protein